MKDSLKLIGYILALVLLVGGIGGCKFMIWKTLHPTAPAWMFFLSK